MSKTSNFNLIILDESGSMSPSKVSTISGCNETLSMLRSLKKEFGDRNEYFVSIYAFQSGSSTPSRYLCKNSKIEKVNDINSSDYNPCGMTPLLDAVGSTLADLEMVADTHDDATGIVTIITDGYENSSQEYTYEHISKIIERMKAKGWTFNFIGANIDVEMVSSKLNINKSNCYSYDSTSIGTAAMFEDLNGSYHQAAMEQAIEESAMPNMSIEEKRASRCNRSSKFFKK
ncbi:MAG: VWA domain-containing protein [Muribaculaceae bacterium]|nr:VWA domain-containing protein [Muribaculaceae bacterium]